MSDIKLVNLVKRFDKTVALDKVSLDVDSGKFVILLGPSGCGKTTTLRCVAGLEKPDEGDIVIDGERVNDVSPRERDVAMVFQNYALYPHLSVFDNLAFPLRIHNLTKEQIRERVNETAKLLNIQRLLANKPKQLSGGEQQRVALGRAIVRRPRVFLMDEPLSNLDAKLRLYMRAELKRLQKDLGVTTVYVTHDQAEAMALADQIAVMNRAKVQQYDTPFKVYNKPANVFVAGFIGSPPMNLIRSTVSENNGRITIDSGELRYTLPDDLTASVSGNLSSSEAFLGIAPEDLKIRLQKTPDAIFEAEVYVVEPIGHSILIDLKVGDFLIKAISPPINGLDSSHKVWVSFDSSSTHLFDGKTENLII